MQKRHKRYIYKIKSRQGSETRSFPSMLAVSRFFGWLSPTAGRDYVAGKRIHPDYEFSRHEVSGSDIPRSTSQSVSGQHRGQPISLVDTANVGELHDLIKTFGQPKKVTITTLTF